LTRVQPSRLAGLLGLFIALYLVLFSAAHISGAILGVERALGVAATATLSVFSRPDIMRTLEVEMRGSANIVYDLEVSARGQRRQSLGKTPFHAHNMVLFAALVLASPGLSLSLRLGALLAGIAAIFAVDVLIVMSDLLSMERKFGIAGHDNVWPLLKLVCKMLAHSQPTGGAFMVPIFVWGLVLAGPFRHQLLGFLKGRAAASESGA